MSKTLLLRITSWLLSIFLILSSIQFTSPRVEACVGYGFVDSIVIEKESPFKESPFTEGDSLYFSGTISIPARAPYFSTQFSIDEKPWEQHLIRGQGLKEIRSNNPWIATPGQHTVSLETMCSAKICNFCVRPKEENVRKTAVGKAHALVGTNKYTMGGKGWNFDPQNDSDTAHKARWATITEIKQTKYTCDTCADNITIGVDCTGLVMWAFNQTFYCKDCPTCDKPECQGCPSYYNIPDESNLCDPYTVIKQQGTEQQWYKDPHISRVNCFSSNKQEGAIDQFLKWSKGGWFNLEPGDIIYFLKPNTKRTHHGHCLIYMGAGWVIQSHSGAGVTVDRLKDILKNKYKGKTINDDLFGFIGVGRFSWNQQNNPQCPSTSAAQISDQAKTAAASYSIQYDNSDGAVVGAYVDGDRGHIVNFTPPSESFTIKKIKIFGAAKIKNTAELKNLVTVRIWDKDGNNQLWSQDVPWSLFLSGTWQDIKVPNVSVNDDFQVEVVTHSQAQGDPIDIVSMTGITPVMDVMGANMLRMTGPVQGDVRSAVLIGFDYPQSCLKSPSPSNCPETRSGYSYMGKLIDPGQGRLEGINWLIRVDGEGAAGN